jgi:hypothetical protein
MKGAGGHIANPARQYTWPHPIPLLIHYPPFHHHTSVVPDFSVGIYKKLLNCERMIQNELPGVRFDFHVRAHQGRKPTRAVPLGARAVFVRSNESILDEIPNEAL